jgi:hypothetical protein
MFLQLKVTFDRIQSTRGIGLGYSLASSTLPLCTFYGATMLTYTAARMFRKMISASLYLPL